MGLKWRSCVLSGPANEATVPANDTVQDVWYALQTRVRFEKSICDRIQRKGHEAYVPVTRTRRRWSDRQQIVELPLFPGYVFVRATLGHEDRLMILQTVGAYCFVTFCGAIACISGRQIEDLRRIEQNNPSCAPHPYLTAGTRVRIRGGCLDGLEGIFVAERSGRLVVSVTPMQRSIALDLDEYEFEML
jgi:transcription termination/antitermination protein NusG